MTSRWDSPEERLTRDVEVRGTEALLPRRPPVQVWCPSCHRTIIDSAVMALCLDCQEGGTRE